MKKPVLYTSGGKDKKYTEVGKDLAKKTGVKHFIHSTSSHNVHSLEPEWCSEIVLKTMIE